VTAVPLMNPQAILESADGMETLPSTAGRLAALVSDGSRSLREIVEVVSLDQSLTATLLRRVNSAASGLRSPARTVREATMLLGTNELLVLALSVSLAGRMSTALAGYGLAEGALWRQSVAASLTTETIRSRARAEVGAEAATAGLLHDLGKVVLCKHFGAPVLDMLSRAAQADGMDLVEAEVAVLGVHHAQIGGLIAHEWRLSDVIVEAVADHHRSDAGLTPTSAAVSLAHAMVPAVLADPRPDQEQDLDEDLDTGAEDGDPVTSHAALFGVLGIQAEDYRDLLLAARERYADLSARYDLG
jgi:HD-like signal output (HDOD) protein